MKKLFFLLFALLLITGCKKTKYSPEGPTDVRFRNITTLNFTDFIVKTSENDEDSDTIPLLGAGQISAYKRYTKAYTKAQITTKISISGTMQTFSIQVPFDYLTYIGQDMVTFEVYILNEAEKKLEMNIVLEGPLTLK